MALLPILRFPDQRLKKVASLVTRIDESTRKLVADMAETMYEAPGIGLAATQVDVHQRIVVIDVAVAFFRAVPGIYDKVERAERVSVSFLDLDGKQQVREAEGLLAVCIQHEIDHLNGTVFVDHLSQLKQLRIKNKMAKQARVTA